MTNAEHNELAQRALLLCGKIVLAVVAKDVPGADQGVEGYYPT